MNANDRFIIDESESSFRLDQVLTKRFLGRYSRAYFQKLIQEGLVLVNGLPVKKRLIPKIGDEIDVEFAVDQLIDLLPEKIPLKILYEDADIIVIDKPAGLVVHPAPGHWTGTFVHALVYHCRALLKVEGGLRPGIVHRLDKDTSGVMIAAKHSEAQRRLIQAFSLRQVVKEYVAITKGYPGDQTIDAPIGRSLKHRQKMAIVPLGKPAITHVHTIQKGKAYSFVRLRIETGRTHQIRVHLSSIGTPVLGDPLYGDLGINKVLKLKRQLLHAELLRLSHPMTQEVLEFKALLPEEFHLLYNH